MTTKHKLLGTAFAVLITFSGAGLAAGPPAAGTMSQTHAQPMTPMTHSGAGEAPRHETRGAVHHRRHHRAMRHHTMRHRTRHAMHHAMNRDTPMAHPMTTPTHH